MSRLKIDELNELNKNSRAVIPIKQFFGEMDIDEEDKERRILLAEDLANIILLFLLMIEAEIKIGSRPDSGYYVESIKNRITLAIGSLSWVNPKNIEEILNNIDNVIFEMVDNTIRQEKTLSDAERAVAIAEDMSNFVGNEEVFWKAKINGYNYKTWITIMDGKERKSHKAMNGKKIPIDQPFNVNGSMMMFPMDLQFKPNPSEYIRCRCKVDYSRK